MKRLIFAVLMFLAASASAQQLSETVNVEVIQVPVYVVGPDGSPIRGLKKDAFELSIDGFPKPIEYFDPVDVATPAKADEPRPERERRLYLLLFDLSCAREECQGLASRIARAQKAASLTIGRSSLDSDLFAVATYTSNRGVQFATPFLRDRVALRRAIGTLAVSAITDPLGLAMSKGERSSWMSEQSVDVREEVAAALMTQNDSISSEIASTLLGGAANQDAARSPVQNTIADQFENFAALAARLSSLEGQKHVLLFSQGFNSTLVHGGVSGADRNTPGGFDGRMLARLHDMFDAFQTQGVFLDTVDIYGLRPGIDPFNNDSLQFMAHGTGGDFVKNRNDVTSALTDLTKRQQVVYLLGFDRRDLARGKINVRVHGVPRGTLVSFRQGFGAPPVKKDVDPLQLADIIINDLPQTGVSMAMGVNHSSLVVAMNPREIFPQLVETSPWIETILYVFDPSGAAVLTKQKRISFDAEARKKDGPIVIGQRLNLPPGQYVAKAITRIGGTASVGFAKAEFKVE